MLGGRPASKGAGYRFPGPYKSSTVTTISGFIPASVVEDDVSEPSVPLSLLAPPVWSPSLSSAGCLFLPSMSLTLAALTFAFTLTLALVFTVEVPE